MKKLGIIAGNGSLPKMLADNCALRNIIPCIIVLDGEGKVEDFERYPHEIIKLGKIGKAISFLKAQGVKDIVFLGGLNRPKLSQLSVDLEGGFLLARLLKNELLGDDKALRIAASFFEEKGFKVKSALDYAEGITLKEGVYSKKHPDVITQKTIISGLNIAKALGEFDIGQSLIMQDNVILGVEAIEGTDELIKRCKSLKRGKSEKLSGVLIKVMKPNQDARLDIPTIGPRTIQNLARNGFAGIAIEAEKVIVIDQEEIRRIADKEGLFVIAKKIN